MSRKESSAEGSGRVLILASFLSTVGFTSIFALLPLYIREMAEPGAATVLWSGLAMAASPLAGAIVSPFWGRLADRMGYRPMLLRALICTTIIIGLMALPNAPWQLVLLRALAGALGSFQPIAMGALTSWCRPDELSRAVSRLQMAQIVGAIVGPLGGGLATATLGVRTAPLFGAVALGVGVLLVARWFHEPAGRRTKLQGANLPFRPALLWLPMLTLVAIQFTDSSFNPILPLLLLQGGMDAGAVGALTGITASMSAIAAAAGSALAGRRFRLAVGYRIVAATLAALALFSIAALAAPVPWGVVGARVLVGALVAGMAIAAFSSGGLAVLPGQRGAAYGWLSSSSMAGFAASPIIAGLLAAIDLRAVLVIDGVLCLASVAAWAWSRGLAAMPASAAPRAVSSAAPPEAPALATEGKG